MTETYSGYVAGTGILMADGSIRTVENLHMGNKLMSPDEHDCYVADVKTEVESVYQVTPIGGVPFTASLHQLLHLVDENVNALSISIKYLLERASQSYMSRFYLNQVSVGAFARKGVGVPHIPPYIAGLIIGQGYLSPSRMKSIIATGESGTEMVTWKNWVASLAALNAIDAYRMNQDTADNDSLIIRCDTAYDARIPDNYKYLSLSKRCDLIAGLLDSQGAVENDYGVYEFNPPSEALVEDMTFLCRSVGLKVIKMKDSTGIRISGMTDRIPCRLQGRSESPANVEQIMHYYRFKITPVGEAECYKFQVTGTGLYMLDSFLIGSCGQGVELSPETWEDIKKAESTVIEEEGGESENVTAATIPDGSL